MDKNFDFLFVLGDIELDEMTVTYSRTKLATGQIASLKETQTLEQKIDFQLPGRRWDKPSINSTTRCVKKSIVKWKKLLPRNMFEVSVK